MNLNQGICFMMAVSTLGCATGGDNVISAGPGGRVDAGISMPDARVEAGSRDGSAPDASPPDASPPDASRPDAMVGCVDEDGDGFGVGETCRGPDCDDSLSAVNPDAVEACNGRDDDCDRMTDEGRASELCRPGVQVMSTACVDGTCRIGDCVDGHGDCNSGYADGCETALNSLMHCGGCGTSCDRVHATASCADGSCGVASCDSGWGDCDGSDRSGCEESLSSSEHCGACGNRCEFANATAACVGSACSLLLCDTGYSNCDGVESNGCELRHEYTSGSCGGGVNLGTYDGDTSCGWPGCGSNTGWDLFGTRTGSSSAWFRARVREDSNCSARIEHRIQLEVPAGVDYDLFVYRSCGGTPLSSRGISGADESITVSSSDSFAGDDDFDYFIEVRYFSGRSCMPWTLRVSGHDC